MFEPITLKRGITHDTAFEEWANLIYQVAGDASISLKDFRKDILIELLNEQCTVMKLFKVYRYCVSEYQVLPEFDSNGNSVAIESIVLQNEGCKEESGWAEIVIEPSGSQRPWSPGFLVV